MEEEQKPERKPVPGRRTSSRWRWMPAIVAALGLFSLGLLLWVDRIYHTQRIDGAFVRALTEVHVKAATSHLWLEEAITGDPAADAQKALADLGEAVNLVKRLRDGGELEPGLFLQPLQDPVEYDLVEQVRSLLSDFRIVAHERIQNPEVAGIGSPLDEYFDSVFADLENKTQALESVMQARRIENRKKSQRLYLGILLGWALIIATATVGLRNREARREQAEETLQAANRLLNSQSEELKRHREHLMDLVEERTLELVTINTRLQQEILERGRTDKALSESRDRFQELSLEFQTLLEAISDPLTLLSRDLKVLWSNRGIACGSRIEEGKDISGRHCYSLRDDSVTPCPGCPAVKCFETEREEITQLEKGNGKIWELRAYPVKNGVGAISNVLTVAVDITEKIRLQAETMRAAHLAALGEMAAGVAHEINNPINGIINYAQILVDAGNRVNVEGNIPTRIMKEGNRIANIVRGLLSFARERREEKRAVNVHDVLDETLALSETQLKKDGITLKVNVPTDLPQFIGHFQQMEQVFLNLINNARYALNQKFRGPDDNKVLEISGENITVDNVPHVKIAFHDQGIGIPANVLNKVMDPFFSTKPKGVGTGLGLSLSHGIVTDHGGKLVLDSKEGQFTEVNVFLPAPGIME